MAKRAREEKAAAELAMEIKLAKQAAKRVAAEEEAKKKEAAERAARTKALSERMAAMSAKAGEADQKEVERRAYLQRKEKEDAYDREVERRAALVKQRVYDVADYVKLQMQAKQEKKIAHQLVKDVQGDILIRDGEEFAAQEAIKPMLKKQAERDFAVGLREQIKEVAARKVTNMSREEAAINKKKMIEIMRIERDLGLNFSAISKENALASQPME